MISKFFRAVSRLGNRCWSARPEQPAMGWSPKLTMVNHGATQWIWSRITVIEWITMTLTCVVLKFAGKLPTCSSVPRRLLRSAAPSRTGRWTIDSHFEWALLWYQTERVLQTSSNALDRFQDVSTCLKSIIVSPCKHLSRGFPCFYHLLPTSRLLALLEPKPQAFRRWDFALSFCHILVRFRWFAVHDKSKHIYEHEMWWREVVTICYVMCLLV